MWFREGDPQPQMMSDPDAVIRFLHTVIQLASYEVNTIINFIWQIRKLINREVK